MRSYRPRSRRVVCRAVGGVAVVSDSNAYVPAQLAEANGLVMLQQYVCFGDGRRSPESEIDLDVFFEEIRSAEKLPTTSHPTTDDFVGAYEKLLPSSDAIVSIHSSGLISQTVQAAVEAVARPGGGARIHAVGSQSARGGLGAIAPAPP